MYLRQNVLYDDFCHGLPACPGALDLDGIKFYDYECTKVNNIERKVIDAWFVYKAYFTNSIIFISVTLIKTKKGKTNIKVGEHTFYLKPGNYKTDKKRWSCTQNKYCKACLHIVDNKIIAINNEHNHEKK